jgi:integrase
MFKKTGKKLILRPFEETLPAAFPARAKGPGLTKTCTMEQWLLHWLHEHIAPQREVTTVYAYGRIVELHLIPALGRVRLCDVTPALFQNYYEYITDVKGLASNTARKHHVLLHGALGLAWRQGLLVCNPLDRVEPPKLTSPRQTYYTAQQLGELLWRVEGTELELPVQLAGFLGLRRSEIAGLRWCDLDLASGKLTVRQVRTAAGREIVCKKPKSSGSMRTLDLSVLSDLTQRLSEEKKARKALAGKDFREDECAILNGAGEPWHPNFLTLKFHDFIQAEGLPHVTLHGLRHTFASVASHQRVPVYQISKALGHSDPVITQRIYTHLFDQTHGEVLSAVAGAIPRRGEALH